MILYVRTSKPKGAMLSYRNMREPGIADRLSMDAHSDACRICRCATWPGTDAVDFCAAVSGVAGGPSARCRKTCANPRRRSSWACASGKSTHRFRSRCRKRGACSEVAVPAGIGALRAFLKRVAAQYMGRATDAYASCGTGWCARAQNFIGLRRVRGDDRRRAHPPERGALFPHPGRAFTGSVA